MQFIVKDPKDPKFESMEYADHPGALVESYKAIGREVNVFPVEEGENSAVVQSQNPPPADIVAMIAAQKQHAMRTGQKLDPWDGMVNAVLAKQNGVPQINAPAQISTPQPRPDISQAPSIPSIEGDFDLGGVKVRVRNGKLFKQDWVLADQSTHRVIENNSIEELQWLEVPKL